MSEPSGRSTPRPYAAGRGPDRRAFLTGSGTALGMAWLGLVPLLEACGREARQARDAGLPFRALSPDEAEALDAITARIVPTDDTPGAHEAAVVHFIDRAFDEGWLPGIDEPIRAFVAMADRAATARGADGFRALSTEDQDALLGELVEAEGSPYGALFAITMMALFANPEYGGNQDEVGWKLIRFEMASGWEPPFGEYDRLYREQGGVA